MTAGMRRLLTSAATVLVGLVALDVAFARYARRHLIPEVTLHDAEAAGDDCMLVLGDSRMVYGVDVQTLADSLRTEGRETCVAQLAIRAMWVSGQAIALRRYLSDGRVPRVIVLGADALSVLPPAEPIDPNELVSNRPQELAWSYASGR